MSANPRPELPLISVIIPHLNQPDALRACLRSLDAQSLDRSQFEVVVVDNGSSSSPEPVVAEHPGARLLEEAEPGPGPARNRGAREANGSILAFIDADCRAHPDWLRAARRALQSSDEDTVLGGDVQIWRSDTNVWTSIEAYESIFSYDQKAHIERRKFSGTGNLVLRRSTFEKVGPFRGITVAEDVDWGQRAAAAGIGLRYVQDMIVFHPARSSLQELFIQWDRQVHHSFNEVRQARFWRTRWLARTLIVLASPIAHLPKIIRSRRIRGWSTRLGAFLVLVAIRAHRARVMVRLMSAPRGIVWNRKSELRLPAERK
jgi:GT2 family glycosyltransferase